MCVAGIVEYKYDVFVCAISCPRLVKVFETHGTFSVTQGGVPVSDGLFDEVVPDHGDVVAGVASGFGRAPTQTVLFHASNASQGVVVACAAPAKEQKIITFWKKFWVSFTYSRLLILGRTLLPYPKGAST